MSNKLRLLLLVLNVLAILLLAVALVLCVMGGLNVLPTTLAIAAALIIESIKLCNFFLLKDN